MHKTSGNGACIILPRGYDLSTSGTHTHHAPSSYLHYVNHSWVHKRHALFGTEGFYNQGLKKNIQGTLLYRSKHNQQERYHPPLPIAVHQRGKALYPCHASGQPIPSNPDDHHDG